MINYLKIEEGFFPSLSQTDRYFLSVFLKTLGSFIQNYSLNMPLFPPSPVYLGLNVGEDYFLSHFLRE